jgi:hypothetical protein
VLLDAHGGFIVLRLQGLGTGTVILLASSGKHSRLLVFSEDLFFIYLLPPIIFNAGYVVMYSCFYAKNSENLSLREIVMNGHVQLSSMLEAN